MLTSIRPRIAAPGGWALLAAALMFPAAKTRGDAPPVPNADPADAPRLASRDATASRPVPDHPVEQALRAIADCQRKYAEVHD